METNMQKLSKVLNVFSIALFLFFVVNAANAQISFVNVQSEIAPQADRFPNTSTWGDVDNDGDPDVYFCSGDTNALMLNDLNGSGQFILADQSIIPVASGGGPRSVIMGDIENDGDMDILSVRSGHKIFLFKNQLTETGTLSFVDIADQVNISLADLTYYSATMADYNNDSLLDILITGVWYEGFVPTVLFKNTGVVNGEVTFEEVSEQAGIFSAMGMEQMGCCWGDYDNDGDQDVYVPTHPIPQEFLFSNNGDGTFTEASVETGLNNSVGSSRGSDFIDYDNDGDLDLFITRATFYDQPDMDICQLWRNDNGVFHEVTSVQVVHRTIRGMAWGDYDNDGDPDLHLAEEGGDDWLFRNDGNDVFVNVAEELGLTKTLIDGWPAEIGDRGGETWCDWDGDGDLDLCLASILWPFFMQNNGGNSNNWLEVKLEGVQSNRSAVGARIYVVTEELRQMREVHVGAGYLCGPPLDQHFGLGQKSIVDSLIVRWPSGVQDVFVNVDVNQILSIKEGSGGAADVELVANSIVKNYKLFQNYPNPFNPTTQISYNITKPGLVRLEIFSILGAKLETIVNESQSIGVHKIEFDASHLSSGMYIYRITAGNFMQQKKMLLMK
jgi:hypothetical protein